jgi:hypothetical protein
MHTLIRVQTLFLAAIVAAASVAADEPTSEADPTPAAEPKPDAAPKPAAKKKASKKKTKKKTKKKNSTTKAKTRADYDAALSDWMAKKLQSEFRAHGNQDARWADDLVEFYPVFVGALIPQFTHEAKTSVAVEKAEALMKAGCDDPLFLACDKRIAIGLQRLREGELSLRTLPAAIREAGYSPFCQFLPMLWRRNVIQRQGFALSDPTDFYQAALATASDPDFAGANARFYVSSVSPRDKEFLFLAAEHFGKPDSGVDPWITEVITGYAEIAKAWDARGSGWAAEVKEEGWKGFAEHISLAREHLTKAHEMRPNFPEAANSMITVSMAESSGEQRMWFDRAVAAEFDYAPAYENLSQALQPRWGGSHEALLAAARECLATKRFDTEVPLHYMLFLGTIAADLPDRRDVFAIPGVYEEILSVHHAYLELAEHSPQIKPLALKSRIALIHWAAGRYAEANKVLDELSEKLVPHTLDYHRTTVDDVVGECRLFGGPHGPAVEAAEAMIAGNHVDEALQAYQALEQLPDIPAGGKRLIASRIKTLKNAKAIEKHDWIDLQPEANLAGWRVVSGEWKVEDDGTLVGMVKEKGPLKLLCETELGKNAEVSLESDLVKQTKRGEPHVYGCNILLAHAAGEFGSDALAVRFGGSAPAVWLTHGFFTNDNYKVAPLQIKPTSTMRVILWEKKVSVFFNDAKVMDKVEVPADWLGGDGLALYNVSPGPPMQMRIRKLRARALEKPPEDF